MKKLASVKNSNPALLEMVPYYIRQKPRLGRAGPEDFKSSYGSMTCLSFWRLRPELMTELN